jgi:hypothetical protein
MIPSATSLSAIQFAEYSAGEDPVAGPERKRVEGHVPGAGGVLDDRDLVPARVQQPCERVVALLPVVASLGSRLVAADLGLPAQLHDRLKLPRTMPAGWPRRVRDVDGLVRHRLLLPRAAVYQRDDQSRRP